MKLQHLLERYTADLRAVAEAKSINWVSADHGVTGLKVMYALLHDARRDRVYDDEHPLFQSGVWVRVLPFDGSEYCEFYSEGADDTHVATLLRAIKKRLSKQA